MSKVCIDQIALNMKAMFPQNVDNSDGHNIDHFYRTAEIATKCLESPDLSGLSDEIKENIILAAFLHDIDDEKFFKTTDYDNARNLLKIQNFPQERIENIILMISYVSYSKNGDSIPPEHYMIIPRLCDRIEAIGYVGLLRCFEYTLSVNRCLHNSETLVIKNFEDFEKISGRHLEYLVGKKSESMIDHFYDKLLHLTFPCNNDIISEMASKGMEIMKNFVIRYWQEFEQKEIPNSFEVLNIIEEFKNK